MLISEFQFFNKAKKHGSIFANIVLKNVGKHSTPRSKKESAQKVLIISL